jgi:polyhydroxyalkanoate synthesis regulator phasin
MRSKSLATPTVRTPAMAIAINSGSILERRFKMMIENRVGRFEPRWLRMGILLVACVVLPLGVTYAQDYEAVGKRLREAVAAGELTGEQARLMLGALRRAEERPDAHGEKAEKRITREDLAAAKKKMRAMVERGEVSEEDVRRRLGEMRRMIGQQRREKEVEPAVDWESIKKRVERAVDRGDMTRREADAKYREIKEGIKARKRLEDRRITREEYAEAEAKMKAMVEAGEAPAEAVRIRLREMRQRMVDSGDADAGRARWEGVRQRIEGAVERGMLTREEADAKYREIRRQTAERERSGKLNWEVIKRRIEAAVASGEMTPEQADVTYRALKQ